MVLLLVLLATPLVQHTSAYVPSVATLREPYIVLPSYLLPALVKPGGILNVLVRGVEEVRVLSSHIYSLAGLYEIRYEGFERSSVTVDPGYTMDVIRLKFKIPEVAPDGLYTIVIESDRGLLWMPNSVIVSSTGGSRGSIRVAHLTDIHFGAEQGGYPNNFKHTRYVALLNTLIERFNLDLVVYTGDLIDVGTDVRSYRDFFMITSQILAPQLAVTGNHDWAQVDNTRLLIERFYGRYVVPLRVWNFTYGDFLFVGLDTRMEGYVEEWQLEYLERVVLENRDKAVVILMHHPLFTNAGEYKGRPEDLRRYIYSSWREAGWSQATRLLEIIERYGNIVAVLSGHVHRDADAVYVRQDGSKVYFITTTTANHGYPEGYYWGMKILEISRSEGVKVITPQGRIYKPTSGSVNTESFLVFEIRDRHSTAVSWVFNTTRFNEFSVGNVTLVFYLNKTLPLESYRVYGDRGRVFKVQGFDLGLYYLVKIQANLTGYGRITVASYEDNVKPRLRVLSMSPLTPTLNRNLILNVEAIDEGWGLERVIAEVRIDGVLRQVVEAYRTMEPSQFRIIVRIAEPGNYEVTLRAVDLNGNVGEEKITFQITQPTIETPRVTTPPETITETITETKETGGYTVTETKVSEATETTRVEVTRGEVTRGEGIDTRLLLVAGLLVALAVVLIIVAYRRRL